MITRLLTAAALSLLATAPAHAAAKRMVSYDSISLEARKLTGAGLTFVFTKPMLRPARILAVHATAVPVGVVLKPSGEGQTNRKLDALVGAEARNGTLYQIDPAEKQGAVMVQAFCPGSKEGWLSISSLAHSLPLRVHAFGDDPATGEPRLCASMDFAFRGEWRMPRENVADPTKEVFAPNY
jgi:hypothetical protein